MRTLAMLLGTIILGTIAAYLAAVMLLLSGVACGVNAIIDALGGWLFSRRFVWRCC